MTKSNFHPKTNRFTLLALFTTLTLALIGLLALADLPTQAAAQLTDTDPGFITLTAYAQTLTPAATLTPNLSITPSPTSHNICNISINSTPTATLTVTGTLTDTPTPKFTATFTATPTTQDTDTPTLDSATSESTMAATVDFTATAKAGRVLVQVVGKTGVFRSGPGRLYPAITSVPRLNKIELSGISEDCSWYIFKYAKSFAWITADPTVTRLILGDLNTLPVYSPPPVPSPRPTSADDANIYNPLTCFFNSRMTEEQQDALVSEMNDALTGEDWHHVGQVARQLYLCPVNATFYLLYTQDQATKSANGQLITDWNTALGLFQQGWNGQ